MNKTTLFRACVLLAGTAIAAGAFAQSGGGGGGGTATYWMSAETTSGMAAMAGMGGGRQPSRGALIGAMLGGRGAGGGADNPGYVHNLRLELGSARRPTGAPAADHFIPAGLNAGPSLPLVTPQRGPAPPAVTNPAYPQGRPQGRILIYWGCGDHARPGQPFEIDLARLGAGQMPPAMAALAARPMVPPSQANSTTFGEWPNQQGRASVPANGSLVGAHSIRGNYSPDINFALAPGQDFLPPIVLTSNVRAASGAVPVAWRPVTGATGYFLMAVGARQDGTMVMWSSSEVQFSQMGAFDYLAPAEVARLVGQRVVLQPTATQCAVPAEVAAEVQAASLMMTAFGPEANFSYPERPARAARSWSPDWTVKLRTRSAYMGMLGMDMAAMMRGESPQQQEQPRRRRSLRDRLLGN